MKVYLTAALTLETPIQLSLNNILLLNKTYARLFVWPSAILLAEFLSYHRMHFRNKRMVELGAGVGMIPLPRLCNRSVCVRA